MSHSNRFQQELQRLGLHTKADLMSLVKPLVVKTIKLSLDPSKDCSKQTQFLSHFRGNPYFESGESWPVTREGKSLDFIFQIVNLEKNIGIFREFDIQVLQFFYNWNSFAWNTKQEGWLIKTYKQVNQEKNRLIEKPAELETQRYCNIILNEVNTLPDWDSIERYNPLASELSCLLNEDEPWASYQEAVAALIGESEELHFSRMGGFPSWLQGDSTPLNESGKPMKLLFQLDSEEKAHLMWGDCGCIYAFYDPNQPDHFEFELQCY